MGPGAELSLADRFTRALLSHRLLGYPPTLLASVMRTCVCRCARSCNQRIMSVAQANN